MPVTSSPDLQTIDFSIPVIEQLSSSIEEKRMRHIFFADEVNKSKALQVKIELEEDKNLLALLHVFL